MQHRYELADLADTRSLAARVAAQLSAGEVLILTGDLGAGKPPSPRRWPKLWVLPPRLPHRPLCWPATTITRVMG